MSVDATALTTATATTAHLPKRPIFALFLFFFLRFVSHTINLDGPDWYENFENCYRYRRSDIICRYACPQSLACFYGGKKGRQNSPDTIGASLLGPAKISYCSTTGTHKEASMRFTFSRIRVSFRNGRSRSRVYRVKGGFQG